MRNRAGNAWLALAGVLVILPASIRSVGAGERSLAGQVMDDRGAGIEGATIYLTALADGRSMTEITTAADGRFRASVPAGRYLLAALKPGYEISLTQVNLRARGLVELRLREAARVVFGDLPDGADDKDLTLDWILRRARAGVLRERELSSRDAVDEAAASRSIPGAAPPDRWLGSILEPLDGRLVQHLTGRTTSLALRGAIGDLGIWRFDGLLERSSVGVSREGATRQGREADLMEIGMDCRLGSRDDLKGEIRFGTGRYVIEPDGGTSGATDQQQRMAGIRSRWDRRLGTAALLYVDGSYWEAGVRIPQPDAPLAVAAEALGGSVDRVVDSQWLTTAGLALERDRHRLDLGIRAKTYRYDLRDRGVLLFSAPDATTPVEAGERGDAMSLFGHDDWRVAEQYILNLGLRYHSNLSAGEAYFVPRIGMTREPATDGGIRVRSMLLFRIDDPGFSSLYSSASERRTAERRDFGRFGYLLGFELRPAERTQLAAAISYRPFEEGMQGVDGGSELRRQWEDPVFLMTDGGAGRHELGIEVERGFGGLSGSLAGSVGRVSGRLTPTLEEAPIQILAAGEARYYLTQLRARYGPSETELEIHYRRVTGEAEAGFASAPDALDYRRFDIVVHQDLPFMRDVTSARWKVLMAYQGFAYGSLYDGAAAAGSGAAASRIAGGLDISF